MLFKFYYYWTKRIVYIVEDKEFRAVILSDNYKDIREFAYYLDRTQNNNGNYSAEVVKDEFWFSKTY